MQLQIPAQYQIELDTLDAQIAKEKRALKDSMRETATVVSDTNRADMEFIQELERIRQRVFDRANNAAAQDVLDTFSRQEAPEVDELTVQALIARLNSMGREIADLRNGSEIYF